MILVAGVAVAWMGFRLFAAGLYEGTERERSASSNPSLLWNQWLPGTLFTLFAGMTLVVGLRLPILATSAAGTNTDVENPQKPETPMEDFGEGDEFPAMPDQGTEFFERMESGSGLIPTEG